MRWTCFLVALVCGMLVSHLMAGEGESPPAARELYQRALQLEQDGYDVEREQALHRALEIDPQFAPAHWQLGHIQLQDQWVDVLAAQETAATHPARVQYAQWRDAARGNLAAEIALAKWARKQGLDLEERMHWLNVLQLQPDNEQAQRRLNLRWFGGVLMTPDQIRQARHRGRLARQRWDQLESKWRDVVSAWRQACEQAVTPDRDELLLMLRDAPLDTEYVAAQLVAGGETSTLHLVGVLADYDHPHSTAATTLLAVFADSEQVRQRAADVLDSRKLHDFVPQLMNWLAMPIESEALIVVDGTGSVHYKHELYQENPQHQMLLYHLDSAYYDPALSRLNRSIEFVQDNGATRLLSFSNLPSNMQQRLQDHQRRHVQRQVNRVASQGLALEQYLQQVNERIQLCNQRVTDVLRQVTDEKQAALPTDWWTWWQDYNHYDSPATKPLVKGYRTKYVNSGSHVPLSAATVRTGSCFVAGTPVWTRTGMRPIEDVSVGELVLSQHPETGELAFQPVIDSTVRDATETREMWIGDESLVTTLGHPFWVTGTGWRMSEQLEPGQRLRTYRGSVALSDVQPGPSEPAFNLVVDGFHTYFVGRQGLLVHDNQLRRPTAARIPGE